MTVEERVRPAATFKPEVASLNMGSMNFGLFPMLEPLQGIQARLGARSTSRTAATSCSRTRSRTSSTSSQACCGERHPVRVRVLRHRAPLQPRPFPRPRAGPAAAVRPDRVRHPGRHRRPPRGRDAHEAHGRPPVRRRTTSWSVLGAGRNQMPIAAMAAAMGGNVRVGLEDSPVDRPGQARREQRRAGPPSAADPRRARPRGREPGRRARASSAEGRRSGRVLTPGRERKRTPPPSVRGPRRGSRREASRMLVDC